MSQHHVTVGMKISIILVTYNTLNYMPYIYEKLLNHYPETVFRMIWNY